jgi:hypothetical protein
VVFTIDGPVRMALKHEARTGQKSAPIARALELEREELVRERGVRLDRKVRGVATADDLHRIEELHELEGLLRRKRRKLQPDPYGAIYLEQRCEAVLREIAVRLGKAKDRFGRGATELAWWRSLEAHADGVCHYNYLIACPDLWELADDGKPCAACAMRQASTKRKLPRRVCCASAAELLLRKMAAGHGVGWNVSIQRIRTDQVEEVASYVTKAAGAAELEDHAAGAAGEVAKMSQAPILAPKGTKRISCSKSFALTPRRFPSSGLELANGGGILVTERTGKLVRDYAEAVALGQWCDETTRGGPVVDPGEGLPNGAPGPGPRPSGGESGPGLGRPEGRGTARVPLTLVRSGVPVSTGEVQAAGVGVASGGGGGPTGGGGLPAGAAVTGLELLELATAPEATLADARLELWCQASELAQEVEEELAAPLPWELIPPDDPEPSP